MKIHEEFDELKSLATPVIDFRSTNSLSKNRQRVAVSIKIGLNPVSVTRYVGLFELISLF